MDEKEYSRFDSESKILAEPRLERKRIVEPGKDRWKKGVFKDI